MFSSKSYKSVFLSPFVYLKPSVWTEALIITILLLLQILLLFVTKSFSSILVIIASLLASFLVDFGNNEKNYTNSFVILSSFIRGCLIGLLLPSSFSPLTVFFISFCVLFVNKHILGGFAASWINPIAVTVALCYIIGMKFFPDFALSISDLQSKNPALNLIQNGTFPKSERGHRKMC